MRPVELPAEVTVTWWRWWQCAVHSHWALEVAYQSAVLMPFAAEGKGSAASARRRSIARAFTQARRKPRDWPRQEAGRDHKEPVRPLSEIERREAIACERADQQVVCSVRWDAYGFISGAVHWSTKKRR